MKKLFSVLTKLGLKPSMPFALRLKVSLVNQMSMVMCCVTLAFIFICFFAYPDLTALPIMGLAISLSTLVLNSFGITSISRLLFVNGINLLCCMFHAFLIMEGEEPLTSVFTLQLGLGLLPFVLFDFSERFSLGLSLLVVIVFLLGFEQFNALLELELDNEAFRGGPLYTTTIIFGLIILFSQIGIFAFQANILQVQSTKLLDQTKERERQLSEAQSEQERIFKAMQEKQAVEELRQKESSATSTFASILQTNEELTIILDRAVKFLTREIDANIGAIYLCHHDSNPVKIKLEASFGYDRKKYFNKTFEPKEGLVGQCYSEGLTIYQTELPERFMNIKSGIGDIPPRSLLIVPLFANENIAGLFEFASIHTLTQRQIEFIEGLGRNMGLKIASYMANQRTKELLVEAQETAETLRAHEEEMRQNMEELSATQEEMQRRETEREELLNDSKRNTQLIKLNVELAKKAHHTTDFDASLLLCLDLICSHFDWPLGHAYRVDKATEMLVPLELWKRPDSNDYDAFHQLIMSSNIAKGFGLPGKAYSNKSIVWTDNISRDTDFTDAELSNRINFGAGMAIPVLLNGEVLFVMEFFSIRVEALTESLKETLQNISNQLSRDYSYKQAKASIALMEENAKNNTTPPAQQ